MVKAYLVLGIRVLAASHQVSVEQPLVQEGLVDLQGGQGVHQGDLHQAQAGASGGQGNNLKHGHYVKSGIFVICEDKSLSKDKVMGFQNVIWHNIFA